MKVRLTNHARERASEMDVRTRLVKQALLDPETVYPSFHGPDQFVAVRGELAVPYERLTDEDGEVRRAITVLWHGQTEREAG